MKISQQSQEEVNEFAFFPCDREIVCSLIAFGIGFEKCDDELIGLCKELVSDGVFPLSGYLFEETSDTQEAFAHLCQCVEQYGLTKLHAFPFSPHQKGETVPAGSFADQISAAVKKERMDILLAVGDRVRETFINKNKGIKHTVLVEGTKDGTRSGWTGNYIHCQGEEQYHRGSLVEVVL